MNKSNVFIYSLLILYLITSISPSIAVPVLRVDSDKTLSTTFDNRFSTDSSYSSDPTFKVYNDGDTPMTISSVTVSNPGSGITTSIYSRPYTISPGYYGTVKIYVKVLSSVSSGRYTGVITIDTLSAGSRTMNLNLDVTTKIPAALGNIGDIRAEVEFNKPKGTVNSFQDVNTITLRNTGDSILYIKSVNAYSPGNGITFSISDKPSSVSPRSSKMMTLTITAPTSTREGTFDGEIKIITTKERRYGSNTQELDVRVTVKYGINIGLTQSSVDFGDTQLYKQKNAYIGISETLGYKPIENLKIYRLTGPIKWLSLTPDKISSIDAGGSDGLNINLLYEGDAKPYEKHAWTYYISSKNAGSKNINIKSRMVFDIDDTICNYKNKGDDTTKKIADEMCGALKYSDDKAKQGGGTKNLNQLIVLNSIATATVDLIDSYIDANKHINNKKHDLAYENLMKGAVSAKMIATYTQDVSDEDVIDDVNFVNQKSSILMNTIMETETNYYETKTDSDLLESMIANERLGEIWGILGNGKKQQLYANIAKEKFELHNEKVDFAKDNRIEAESLIKEMQEEYLSKWGGMYLLTSPFSYSKISSIEKTIEQNYNTAVTNYKTAGEKDMTRKTNTRLSDIKSSFNKMLSIFYILTGFYTILFIGAVTSGTKAMMAYVRDTSETRMGDDFI